VTWPVRYQHRRYALVDFSAQRISIDHLVAPGLNLMSYTPAGVLTQSTEMANHEGSLSIRNDGIGLIRWCGPDSIVSPSSSTSDPLGSLGGEGRGDAWHG
jgi:hypothetical protein